MTRIYLDFTKRDNATKPFSPYPLRVDCQESLLLRSDVAKLLRRKQKNIITRSCVLLLQTDDGWLDLEGSGQAMVDVDTIYIRVVLPEHDEQDADSIPDAVMEAYYTMAKRVKAFCLTLPTICQCAN